MAGKPNAKVDQEAIMNRMLVEKTANRIAQRVFSKRDADFEPFYHHAVGEEDAVRESCGKLGLRPLPPEEAVLRAREKLRGGDFYDWVELRSEHVHREMRESLDRYLEAPDLEQDLDTAL